MLPNRHRKPDFNRTIAGVQMDRNIGLGLGVFIGLLDAAMALLAIEEMPLQAAPGALLFAGLSAILPSFSSMVGFALGHRHYPSHPSTMRAFFLGLLLGVAIEIARNAPLAFNGPIAATGIGYLGALFLGGFCIALIARQGARQKPQVDAGRVKRTISQTIALVELGFFVYPTLILLPLSVLILIVERFEDPVHLILGLSSSMIAVAALMSLIGLLGAFLNAGRSSLIAASRVKWALCGLGTALVAVGTAVFMLQAIKKVDLGPCGLFEQGIFGLPALMPALHMFFERWMASKE